MHIKGGLLRQRCNSLKLHPFSKKGLLFGHEVVPVVEKSFLYGWENNMSIVPKHIGESRDF